MDIHVSFIYFVSSFTHFIFKEFTLSEIMFAYMDCQQPNAHNHQL